jgi:hypothetical protein
MFGFGLSFSVIDLLSLQLKFKFSYFECTVVWLNQNLTLTFLVLSALTAIVYHFSAKKFIHAEVR